MSISVQFHYDFGSPNTYYCHRVIPEIEQRTGVKFDYVPVLLGGIFKSTNNKSPMEQFSDVENKWAYQALETKRFIAKHGIDKFKMNSNFPVNTLYLMRGATYAQDKDWYTDYIEAMYQCMWEQDRNMGDAEEIGRALNDFNLPAEEIIAACGDADVKKALMDSTAASVARGSFGSPTFYIGGEIFFGKDRLRDVEEEIQFQLA